MSEREDSEATEPSETPEPNEAPEPSEALEHDVAGPLAVEPAPTPEPTPEPESTPEPEPKPAAASEPADAEPSKPPTPPTPTPLRPRVPEPGTPIFVPRSPTQTLVQMIKPNAAVILLGAVFLLAVIEIIAAFLAYREQIAAEDWVEVAALLDEREGEPVLVASEWLAPRARMELAATRGWDSVAPPDLRGVPSFWVLGFGRDVWSSRLNVELEGLPMPELVAIHSVGALMLAEYRQADPGERLWSLLERDLAIESAAGRCTGKRNAWSCKDGRVLARVVEVDYQPRRCLAIALDEGSGATIELGKVELGNRLRGHVGFADFNARLRADPTVVLEAWIDDELAARWLFTDDQGWAAFALATEPGKRRLTMKLRSTVTGTWQRQPEGLRPSPNDLPCVEARAFVETEPPVEVAAPSEPEVAPS